MSYFEIQPTQNILLNNEAKKLYTYPSTLHNFEASNEQIN